MTKKAADTTTLHARGDDHYGVASVAADLLGTAWRIAVPAVLGAGAGIVADRALHTAPWCTLVGLAVGFVFAGLLVRRQLIAIEREDR